MEFAPRNLGLDAADQQTLEHGVERWQSGEQTRQFHLIGIQVPQLPDLFFFTGAEQIALGVHLSNDRLPNALVAGRNANLQLLQDIW
ncbi:hypothetical protein D3C84_972350 [compost metagenome]